MPQSERTCGKGSMLCGGGAAGSRLATTGCASYTIIAPPVQYVIVQKPRLSRLSSCPKNTSEKIFFEAWAGGQSLRGEGRGGGL